ncbi:MAG: hypothetical protein PHC81_07125, partial [Clostridia bacterium]|nr:hypothetical protein [Clostridia bacterium]
MKKIISKIKGLLVLLLLLFIVCGTFPLPVKATTPSLPGTDSAPNLPQEIFPLHKTKIELHEQKITLNWSEKTTMVSGAYHLVNPGEKKTTLKIGICLPTPPKEETNSAETSSPLKVFYQEEEVKTTYNKNIKGYVWEITIAPGEEADLGIQYSLPNKINEQGLSATGYRFSSTKTNFRASESSKFSLVLNFLDTHPGQIIKLEPCDYSFAGDSLVWEGDTTTGKKDIMITADLLKESQEWTDLLSTEDKKQLSLLTSQEQYREAASLLENKYYNFTKNEEKQLLLLGQAYYLEKAGSAKKALALFADLVNNEVPYPRAYWEVGKSYEQHTNKLTNLFYQIQELQIHALLQPWLMAKLPPEKAKLSPPEITIKDSNTDENRQGILIKSHLTDKDGDISKIILRYHWEGGQKEEVNFAVQPFQYDYDLSYFTPAPAPFKRLFYEFTVTDSAGQEATSEIKEAFYLNDEIPSSTFILEGANLIFGDYTPQEQNKIYKWFKSYLKMAQEAGFVPVEARSPLFI